MSLIRNPIPRVGFCFVCHLAVPVTKPTRYPVCQDCCMEFDPNNLVELFSVPVGEVN